MEVNFSGNKDIILVQEQKVTLDKLTVVRMVDLPEQKKVVVFLKEIAKPTVLWEGAAYDAAGQWTDSDVAARLLEIYGA